MPTSLSPDDIRAIAHEAGREGAREGVCELMTRLGIALDTQADAIELQKDFAHLRSWRTAVLSAKLIAFKTTVATLATGALGVLALWFSAAKPPAH